MPDPKKKVQAATEPPESTLPDAQTIFEEFNMRDMRGVNKGELALPKKQADMEDWGICHEINYVSYKQTGNPQEKIYYSHDFEPAFPRAWIANDESFIYLTGGDWGVEDGWLVD